MAPKSFPWGDNPFPPSLFMGSILFAGVVGYALLTMAPTSVPGVAAGMSLHAVRETILASLAWVWVYYNGLGGQVRSRPPLSCDRV